MSINKFDDFLGKKVEVGFEDGDTIEGVLKTIEENGILVDCEDGEIFFVPSKKIMYIKYYGEVN